MNPRDLGFPITAAPTAAQGLEIRALERRRFSCDSECDVAHSLFTTCSGSGPSAIDTLVCWCTVSWYQNQAKCSSCLANYPTTVDQSKLSVSINRYLSIKSLECESNLAQQSERAGSASASVEDKATSSRSGIPASQTDASPTPSSSDEDFEIQETSRSSGGDFGGDAGGSGASGGDGEVRTAGLGASAGSTGGVWASRTVGAEGSVPTSGGRRVSGGRLGMAGLLAGIFVQVLFRSL